MPAKRKVTQRVFREWRLRRSRTGRDTRRTPRGSDGRKRWPVSTSWKTARAGHNPDLDDFAVFWAAIRRPTTLSPVDVFRKRLSLIDWQQLVGRGQGKDRQR